MEEEYVCGLANEELSKQIKSKPSGEKECGLDVGAKHQLTWYGASIAARIKRKPA